MKLTYFNVYINTYVRFHNNNTNNNNNNNNIKKYTNKS